MKKAISICLILAIALSLCACGALDVIRNTELPPRPTPIRESEDAAPTPEKAESTPTVTPREPAPEGLEDGAELGERVTIYFKQTKETEYAPDDESLPILLFSYVTPVVRMDDNPAAAEMINEQLRLFDEQYYSGSGFEGGKNHLYEAALDNLSYIRVQNSSLTPFSSARTVECTRADGSVISLLYWTSVYTGGNQDLRAYVGRSYSSESGEKLSLDKLSADPEAFRERLRRELIAAAREEKDVFEQISGNDLDVETALAALVREDNWYFGGEGIVFFSGWGEIAPEEYGILRFTIPYEALADVIDSRYLPADREGDGTLSIRKTDDLEEGSVWIIDRLAVSEGEELCLTASGIVYDVTISSILYSEQEDQEDRFFETARLWYANYLNDCALQICTLVPEGMPDLMVRYTDSAHLPHRLFISQSGADGGVTLVDDTIRAVG